MAFDLGQLLQDLTSTRAFARLKGVSFLGIVDRYNVSEHSNRKAFTRAEHSLGVLRLGAIAATHIGLGWDDAAHLFAACLVHDIGHAPFSHSVEYAFPKSLRVWNHHRVLGEILLSPAGPEREVPRALAKHGISSRRVYDIVNGADALSFFFESPMNIDTLDGINRSMWSFGFFANFDIQLLTKYTAEIYSGMVFNDDRLRRHADAFWSSKGAFYKFLASDSRVAVVERNFQAAVRGSMTELSREIFRLTDKDFVLRYPQVIVAATTEGGRAPSGDAQEFLVDEGVRQLDKQSVYQRYRRVRREVREHRSQPH